MVEIESISSLFLPAGGQGGRGQSLALSNEVNFSPKEAAIVFIDRVEENQCYEAFGGKDQDSDEVGRLGHA